MGAKGEGLKQFRGKGERAVKLSTESKLCVRSVSNLLIPSLKTLKLIQ